MNTSLVGFAFAPERFGGGLHAHQLVSPIPQAALLSSPIRTASLGRARPWELG